MALPWSGLKVCVSVFLVVRGWVNLAYLFKAVRMGVQVWFKSAACLEGTWAILSLDLLRVLSNFALRGPWFLKFVVCWKF